MGHIHPQIYSSTSRYPIEYTKLIFKIIDFLQKTKIDFAEKGYVVLLEFFAGRTIGLKAFNWVSAIEVDHF